MGCSGGRRSGRVHRCARVRKASCGFGKRAGCPDVARINWGKPFFLQVSTRAGSPWVTLYRVRVSCVTYVSASCVCAGCDKLLWEVAFFGASSAWRRSTAAELVAPLVCQGVFSSSLRRRGGRRALHLDLDLTAARGRGRGWFSFTFFVLGRGGGGLGEYHLLSPTLGCRRQTGCSLVFCLGAVFVAFWLLGGGGARRWGLRGEWTPLTWSASSSWTASAHSSW